MIEEGIDLPLIKRIIYACIIFAIIFITIQTVTPRNVGVTIQTTRSTSYGATAPLREETTAQLDMTENSDSAGKIGDALKQLKDGDILVLSVHSNPEMFGSGDNIVKWSDFWSSFGISKPPKLGIIIIGGCMLNEKKGASGEVVEIPASEKQQEDIRAILNADALFAPTSAINPIVAGIDTSTLLKSIKNGKKLCDINLGGKWNYISSPAVDRNSYRWSPNCPDISGSWSGILEVKDNGGSDISKGMKRPVNGDRFSIIQNGCDITLKFDNNEISGKMEKGIATLTDNPKGTLTEAILTFKYDTLNVTMNQKSPAGYVVRSAGDLTKP